MAEILPIRRTINQYTNTRLQNRNIDIMNDFHDPHVNLFQSKLDVAITFLYLTTFNRTYSEENIPHVDYIHHLLIIHYAFQFVKLGTFFKIKENPPLA